MPPNPVRRGDVTAQTRKTLDSKFALDGVLIEIEAIAVMR